jgi:hypothetical protein
VRLVIQSEELESQKNTTGFEKRCPGGACLKLSPAIPSKDVCARPVPWFDDLGWDDFYPPVQIAIRLN